MTGLEYFGLVPTLVFTVVTALTLSLLVVRVISLFEKRRAERE